MASVQFIRVNYFDNKIIIKIMKVRSAGCLRLICIAVAGLGTPLSRLIEGAPYKFLNE